MEVVINEKEIPMPELGDVVMIKGEPHLVVKTIGTPYDAHRLIHLKSCTSVLMGYSSMEALMYYIKELDPKATIYRKNRVKLIIE